MSARPEPTEEQEQALRDAGNLFKAGLVATLGISGAATALALLENPIEFIEQVIEFFIFEQFLLPAVEAVIGLFLFIGDGLILVMFGSDGNVGVSQGDLVGIADIPFWIVLVLGEGGGQLEFVLFSLLNQFNEGVIALIPELGPLALPVVVVIDVLLIGTLAWAFWAIIINVDIPFIEVEGIIRTISAPFRLLLRLFRG